MKAMLTLNASASSQQRETEETVAPSGKFQSLISPAIKLISTKQIRNSQSQAFGS